MHSTRNPINRDTIPGPSQFDTGLYDQETARAQKKPKSWYFQSQAVFPIVVSLAGGGQQWQLFELRGLTSITRVITGMQVCMYACIHACMYVGYMRRSRGGSVGLYL